MFENYFIQKYAGNHLSGFQVWYVRKLPYCPSKLVSNYYKQSFYKTQGRSLDMPTQNLICNSLTTSVDGISVISGETYHTTKYVHSVCQNVMFWAAKCAHVICVFR
jgi:hypothetical protein